MVMMPKRLNEPPMVSGVRFIQAYSASVREPTHLKVGNRPSALYEVADSFPILSEKAQYQRGMSVGPVNDQPDFVAVLVRELPTDAIVVPTGFDLLASFPPIPGQGHYGLATIRVSVIFWGGDFWAPVLAIDPDREKLCEAVYGELEDWRLDVLYKIVVSDVPHIIDSLGDPEGMADWLS